MAGGDDSDLVSDLVKSFVTLEVSTMPPKNVNELPDEDNEENGDKPLRHLPMIRKKMPDPERRLAHLRRQSEGRYSAHLTERVGLRNRFLVPHRLQTAGPKLGELS